MLSSKSLRVFLCVSCFNGHLLHEKVLFSSQRTTSIILSASIICLSGSISTRECSQYLYRKSRYYFVCLLFAFTLKENEVLVPMCALLTTFPHIFIPHRLTYIPIGTVRVVSTCYNKRKHK